MESAYGHFRGLGSRWSWKDDGSPGKGSGYGGHGITVDSLAHIVTEIGDGERVGPKFSRV
ncbi:MAG: hypothetical protein CM1200mP3_06400 [Chloroflexota bacterium]|nr:MAG: hypothetical protein CM1200mP3_06400 [Chloroflexota bacterium]